MIKKQQCLSDIRSKTDNSALNGDKSDIGRESLSTKNEVTEKEEKNPKDKYRREESERERERGMQNCI